MKLAIVSIEDKRFAAHNGVDLQGTLTGLAGFLKGAGDARGGSTIEQQYIKNFNLLVNAETDEERQGGGGDHAPFANCGRSATALALDTALSAGSSPLFSTWCCSATAPTGSRTRPGPTSASTRSR